jgi:hypothetical protein
LVEDFVGAAGCPAEHPNCFRGRLEGRGLCATTLFFAEATAAVPPQSPGWRSYSGLQEYTTEHGTLLTRETGLSNNGTGGTPSASGGSLSLEDIIAGTGQFAGASGYLFVSGFVDEGHVESRVTGKICIP